MMGLVGVYVAVEAIAGIGAGVPGGVPVWLALAWLAVGVGVSPSVMMNVLSDFAVVNRVHTSRGLFLEILNLAFAGFLVARAGRLPLVAF